MTDEEKDLAAYNSYIELWKSENPIKTNKLQILLFVNGLLVSALQLAGGFKPENWFIFLTGGVFSLIWLLSIGRTSLFQKVWKIKANEISRKHSYANNPIFQLLDTSDAQKEVSVWVRAFGSVPSKYYLLGTPITFSILWFGFLMYIFH